MRLATVILIAAIANAGCKSKDLLADQPDAGAPDAGACGGAPGPIVYYNVTPTVIGGGRNSSLSNTWGDFAGTTLGANLAPGQLETLVGCLSDLFAPFGVAVVTQDPGAVDHVEIVVTEHPSELGSDSIFSSVAPFSCDPPRSPLALGFLLGRDADGSDVCKDLAVPVGVVAGASFSQDCNDVMSGLADCGPNRSFVDDDVACGQYAPEDCICSGEPTQNTHQIMADYFASFCPGGGT